MKELILGNNQNGSNSQVPELTDDMLNVLVYEYEKTLKEEKDKTTNEFVKACEARDNFKQSVVDEYATMVERHPELLGAKVIEDEFTIITIETMFSHHIKNDNGYNTPKSTIEVMFRDGVVMIAMVQTVSSNISATLLKSITDETIKNMLDDRIKNIIEYHKSNTSTKSKFYHIMALDQSDIDEYKRLESVTRDLQVRGDKLSYYIRTVSQKEREFKSAVSSHRITQNGGGDWLTSDVFKSLVKLPEDL
jgi:hypothetical protein